MIHKVRLWIENGVVQCCSGVCTEQSCNRVGICKETEIAEVTRCMDCGYSIDRSGEQHKEKPVECSCGNRGEERYYDVEVDGDGKEVMDDEI